MARDNLTRHHTAFRPEDEIDEVFGNANPNSNRINCPRQQILRSAGRKALPIDHPVYEHLAGCSACYQEFRRYQQRERSAWRFRPAIAAAAVVLVAVTGTAYLARNLGIGSSSDSRTTAVSRPVLIDYRAVSTTRSEGGDPDRAPVRLPREYLDASILLPVGSEPGPYEVRLLDGDRQVKFSKEESSYLRDFVVRIDVKLDLRSFVRGSYYLGIRRLGEIWDTYPVVIQ
jgi:hypothetical protein